VPVDGPHERVAPLDRGCSAHSLGSPQSARHASFEAYDARRPVWSPQPDSAAAPMSTSVTQAEDFRGRRDMGRHDSVSLPEATPFGG